LTLGIFAVLACQVRVTPRAASIAAWKWAIPPVSPDQAVVTVALVGEGAVLSFVLDRVGNQWQFEDIRSGGEDDPGE
jgi:hypothetical protein